jgi:hypothetical protein
MKKLPPMVAEEEVQAADCLERRIVPRREEH